jgi:hypothetical protein
MAPGYILANFLYCAYGYAKLIGEFHGVTVSLFFLSDFSDVLFG